MAVLHWILIHGYWLMFLAMLVEGPIVTAAAAFAAKLGYFNIEAILGLSILGNIIPDVILYAMGYWGRMGLVDRFGKKVGLTKDRLKRLERLLHKHMGKTLFVVKVIPVLAVPGLMAAGLARLPLKKYIFWCIAIIIPTSFGFLLIGYYTGSAYNVVVDRIDNASYVAAGAIAVIVLAAYLWKKFAARLAAKLEKI